MTFALQGPARTPMQVAWRARIPIVGGRNQRMAYQWFQATTVCLSRLLDDPWYFLLCIRSEHLPPWFWFRC